MCFQSVCFQVGVCYVCALKSFESSVSYKNICLAADDERRIRGVVPQHRTEGNKLLCVSIVSAGAFEPEEAVHFSAAALRTTFSFSIVQVCI